MKVSDDFIMLSFLGTLITLILCVIVSICSYKEGEKTGYDEGIKDLLTGKIKYVELKLPEGQKKTLKIKQDENDHQRKQATGINAAAYLPFLLFRTTP